MAFDLKSISRTRRLEAPKILLAGEPKIGKSTFASSAPAAIGICTEDGLAGIDAQAFPVATTLDDVYSAIGVLLALGATLVFSVCIVLSTDEETMKWCVQEIQKLKDQGCTAGVWHDPTYPSTTARGFSIIDVSVAGCALGPKNLLAKL